MYKRRGDSEVDKRRDSEVYKRGSDSEVEKRRDSVVYKAWRSMVKRML